MKPIFPSFYLGSIEYYAKLQQYESVLLEKMEHYPKQTFRNRCEIQGANGKLMLTVPIKRTGNRKIQKDVVICNEEDWAKIHWKSLESSYRCTPYFEYYEHEFQPIYEKKHTNLVQLNEELHQLLLRLLAIEVEYSYADKYMKGVYDEDFRDYFKGKNTLFSEKCEQEKYIQVFSDRMEFLPNLSIVDLLFNEGPNSVNYLKKVIA